MYVQCKPNKSGSISVYVMGEENGTVRLIKNFGVAYTKEELQVLQAEADRYTKDPSGAQLELFKTDRDQEVTDFFSVLKNSQLQVIGPELIYGALYNRIGYNQIDNDMFRHLVITRLFKPGSKLKTIEYLGRYLGVHYRIDRIYRCLDNVCYREGRKSKKPDIKTQVDQITFEYTRKVLGGQISVVFYDMTTLYFEASDEDDMRIPGFSKDGKNTHPQIFLGLLVAAGGNPIGYEVFKGNIYEGHTLIPVLEKLSAKFGLGRPIVIADSGLLNKNNVVALQENGYEYILGAKLKNEGEAIQKAILSRNLNYGEVAIFERDAVTRLVVSRTENRAKKDAYNRKRKIKKMQKKIGNGKVTKDVLKFPASGKGVVLEGNATMRIDWEALEAESAWDGIKGYITNSSLPAKEVIANYGQLWFIERSFRMNKTDLRIRPMYHRLKERLNNR